MKQTWRRACLGKVLSVVSVVTMYLIGRRWFYWMHWR